MIVISSLMDQEALDRTLEGWSRRVLGELPLFFERLYVLELRRPR